ncbi:HU family DNA-binding protein [Candidatus Finniella inopinata]|uniref:Integration host factor subunit beta n=1 Tax=Candidatus Finniella inopinata TaxID=1696036 RepID=A0A4Q7DIB9_9PROT|nr:HU family DNA-binding protein [Candidatus Finniella inopinata]RZI46068.1 integration host factor subunit beta [Candidatus Finniella inopinata]
MNPGETKATQEGQNFSPDLVKKALDVFFETIQSALLEKRRVEIRRFGIFSLCTRPARKARNPGTGETVFIPERTYLQFKMGKQLQSDINQSK